MTEPTHRKLRSEPGKKRVSDEAFARGQALYQLILKLGFEPASFAAEAGLALSTVWLYINGAIDLASVRQPTVEKLLGALDITDTWAWQHFNIPKDARRSNWRTFRPPPLGHGEDPRELYELPLDRPTTGRYMLWPGDILTLDPGNTALGIMVARLGEELVLNERRALPPEAEVLGQLVRIEPGFPVHEPKPRKSKSADRLAR